MPFWQWTFTGPKKIQACKRVRWIECVGCWRMSCENKAIWRRKWRNMTEYLVIKTAKVRSRFFCRMYWLCIAWSNSGVLPKVSERGCASRTLNLRKSVILHTYHETASKIDNQCQTSVQTSKISTRLYYMTAAMEPEFADMILIRQNKPVNKIFNAKPEGKHTLISDRNGQNWCPFSRPKQLS